MKNKRFLLTVFMMAIVGWQSAFAIDPVKNGDLLYRPVAGQNQVTVAGVANDVTALTNVIITPTINLFGDGTMYTVVGIEDGAFMRRSDNGTVLVWNINTLSIPNTVTSVGEYAFYNCQIGTVRIDPNANLTIGNQAFGGAQTIDYVEWCSTAAAWCSFNFLNNSTNPIAHTSSLGANYRTELRVDYNATTGSYTTFVPGQENVFTYTNAQQQTVTAYRASEVVLPAGNYAITKYAFAGRSFERIKTYCSAATIDAATFGLFPLTTVSATCLYVSTYETNAVWGTAKEINTFIDFDPNAGRAVADQFDPSGNVYIKSQLDNVTTIGHMHIDAPVCGGDYDSLWTLTCNVEPGYEFVRWSNGSTDNPLRGKVGVDIIPNTVVINRINYIINASIEGNNTAYGSIEGNGSIHYGETVNLIVHENNGYKFVRWSDGNLNNPRTITVNDPTLFDANNTFNIEAYFDVTTPFDRNLVLNETYSNTHLNNLWAFKSNSANKWAIVDGRLIITNDGTTNDYDQTVATTAYAYRIMNVKAGTYYKLTLGYNGTNLKWAMVPANAQTVAGDFSGVATTEWKPLTNYPYTSLKTDSANFTYSGTTNTEYVLVLRWTNTPSTPTEYSPHNANIASAVDNLLFKERKFNVKASSSSSSRCTVAGAAWVYSGEEVELTATPKTGYHFTNWSATNLTNYIRSSETVNSNPIHITPVNNDITVTANCSADGVTVYFQNNTKDYYYVTNETPDYSDYSLRTTGSRCNDYLTADYYTYNYSGSGSYLYRTINYNRGLNGNSVSPYTREVTSATGTTTVNTDSVQVTGLHGSSVSVTLKSIVPGWEIKSLTIYDNEGNQVSNNKFRCNWNSNSHTATITISMDVAINAYKFVPVFTKKTYDVVIRNRKDVNVTVADYVDTTMGVIGVQVNNASVNGTNQTQSNGIVWKKYSGIEYMSSVKLTATTKQSNGQDIYKFVRFEDAAGTPTTYSPYTFTVDGVTRGANNNQLTFDSYFDYKQYKVTAFTENLEKGNIKNLVSPDQTTPINVNGIANGAGKWTNVRYRNTVMMEAERYSGYMFSGWVKVDNTNTQVLSEDTIMYNPYTFSPTADVYYRATFKPATDYIQDTVIYNYVYENKDTTIYVTSYVDTIAYRTGSTVDTVAYNITYVDTTIINTDTTIIPVYQTQTVITYDTVIETRTVVRDSIVVNEVVVNNPVYHDTVIYITSYQPQYVDTIIYNYINQPVYHYVDTTIYNPVYIDVPYRDTIIVNIDTVYTICTTDTIINTVVDTVINNVHDTTIVYSYDTIYLPVYDTVYIHDTVYVGINDAAQNDNINVYQSGNQIVVNGTEGNVVRLFDAVGRMLATKQDPYGEVYFEAPATGTYLVKVGNYQAKRIVVVL